MANNNTTLNTLGTVKISDEAIATISSLSARQVEGVSGVSKSFVGNILSFLGRKNRYRGVSIEMSEGEVAIEINIDVKFGVDIPSVASDVQEAIKENIEKMTGMAVKEVSVNIRGIVN